MKIHKKEKLKYLTFDSFEKTRLVKHAFSTRCGGVSEGYFAELNLGFNRGEEREKVLSNYKLFCDAVSVDYENMVFSDQVHGVAIRHVKKGDTCKEIDALISNQPNVVLATVYADCVPLYFLDTEEKVIALAHAGWRGTAAEIARLTIEEMQKVYACKTENIIAGIGPAISSCCFEVDSPVYEAFKKFHFAEDYITASADKFYIDLKGMNKQIMIHSGLKEENIETADICTKCNAELFYSHRRMGTNRGTMIAVMELVGN